MNKKITLKFTFFTFLLTYVLWGTLVVCGQFDITLSRYAGLYVLYILGGFSPAIASFMVLKKNNEVSGLKEWLKNVFNIKSRMSFYFICVFLMAMVFFLRILVSGLTAMNPIYLLFVYLPVMVIGGGMEEAGWRYVLQPELDKKFGFILSSLITAPIWAVWHLPLFFIPGTTQYTWNFDISFVIGILGLTFALGAIRKISGNVFLCVLAHSIFNSASGVFMIDQTFSELVLSNGLLIGISIAVVFVFKRNKSIQ